MNITKPEQMTSGTSKVEEAVSKLEEQFAKMKKTNSIITWLFLESIADKLVMK